MEWEEYAIGETVEVSGGGTPDTENNSYWDGDVLWITPTEASNASSRFVDDTKRKITDAGLKNSAARLMPVRTILLTSRATIGDVVINKKPMATNQGFINIICNDEFVLTDYFFYWLKVHKELILAYANGATFLEISKSEFKKIKIKLPPLPVQRRIAQVLGRYDALIENYAAQIRTLEAVAQNLYREWFVRHRINGGELPIDEKTKLPVGWEEKELGEIAADKRRIVKAKDLEADMPYVGLEHLSIKSIIIKNCGVAEDVDSDKLSFEKNDILFGKIRPYLHKVCLSHFAGVCSSDTIVIKPIIENALGFVMLTVFDEKFVEFADKISNGTKMPRAEWSVLKTYKIAVPPEDALKAFEKIVSPMFAKMENLQTQISNLRQMRDKLLPRLLSGKIAVKV